MNFYGLKLYVVLIAFEFAGADERHLIQAVGSSPPNIL